MKFIKISIIFFFIVFLNSSALAALATSEINFGGTLIKPANCTVNNSSAITVSFGTDVLTTSVNGTANSKPIPFTVSCTDMTSTGVKYQITGVAAGFNGTNTLQTTNKDLGITIKSGANALPLNTKQTITYTTIPSLTGTLSKRAAGTTLTAGAFTAGAKIELEYD